MEVTTGTQTRAAAVQAADTNSASGITADFDTFLKLMTAQLQNQDPLNPQDPSDYSTQLATFSGVEQQVQTNDLLRSLGAQLGVAGLAQMASWIGMEARVAAPAYFDGSPISISPNPAHSADRAILVVYDHDGNEVQRSNFQPTTNDIEWAGVNDNGNPFPAGLYTFKVESYAGDQLLSTDIAEIYSEIREAKSKNGETVLVLEGGAEVSSDEVSALRGL